MTSKFTEFIPESRIGFLYALCVVYNDGTVCYCCCNGGRHSDSVIGTGVYRAAAIGSGINLQRVLVCVAVDTKLMQHLRNRCDTIGFFQAQTGYIFKGCTGLRTGGYR